MTNSLTDDRQSLALIFADKSLSLSSDTEGKGEQM